MGVGTATQVQISDLIRPGVTVCTQPWTNPPDLVVPYLLLSLLVKGVCTFMDTLHDIDTLDENVVWVVPMGMFDCQVIFLGDWKIWD